MKHFCVLALALATGCGMGTAAEPRVEHVVIVSIDGAKPEVVKQVKLPVLESLVSGGAHTWTARTIVPPKTLPSHTSMVTGVGPDKHHILWNDWMPIRGLVKVPTIFSLVKAADPAAGTAMFCGKVKFRHLWMKDSLDVFDLGGPVVPGPAAGGDDSKVPAQTVAGQVTAYLAEKAPAVTFVHFPDVDSAGHASGWGSEEQKAALEVCDQALGQIVRAVKASPMAGSVVVLVTADHGGHDKTHGLDIPADMEIPWIAWGSGVKAGVSLTQPVTTYDTAATALWLLGVPVPDHFDGRPVMEAFEGESVAGDELR